MDFKPLKGNSEATLELVYDIALVSQDSTSTDGATAPAPNGLH